MPELDTALSLIQLVALFLPAWAILMQVLIHIMGDMEIEKNPTFIPFYALAFALGFSALYLFGRGSFYIMSFFIEEGYITGSGPLPMAISDLMRGGLAFTGLGCIVLLAAAQKQLSFERLKLVFALSVGFVVLWWLGWLIDSITLTIAGTFFVLFIGEAIVIRSTKKKERVVDYIQ